MLAFACAFTMFAGAAFTDQADIAVDSDVVDTLVALGVIDGYEDGTFRPDDTVTRAEMAKMIYTVRTGRSDASAYNDDTTSFTDITSHWARGYIKYCQSMGIIAGKSVTSFDPDGTVTTQEAAKMLLVTLGYDAEKAGLEGASWGQKTTALADENGLLKDVNNGTTQGLPRQYAAQIIYNAIFAPTVEYRDGAYYNKNLIGLENDTIGEKYMGLKLTIGTLDDVTKESGKSTYRLNLSQTPSQAADSTGKNPVVRFTNVASDYSDLKNQTVKVLYKDDDEVYGVFATEDTQKLLGVLADMEIDGEKLKVDGTKYSFADDAKLTVDDSVKFDCGKEKEAAQLSDITGYIKTNTANSAKAYAAQVILNDADRVSEIRVTTFAVAKVSYVGSDYINLTSITAPESDAKSAYTQDSKLDTDEANYASDLAKDDYVMIVPGANAADGKAAVTKLDVVEGKVTSTKGKPAEDDYQISVDGNWYEMSMAAGKFDDVKLNTEASFAIKDGFVVAIGDATNTSKDVALLIEVGKSSAVGADWQADVLFADGTRETIDVKAGDADTAEFDKTELGELANDGATGKTTLPAMVSYERSSGKYVLSQVWDNAGERAGYEKFSKLTTQIDNNRFPGGAAGDVKYIDAAATVFVRYSDDEYDIITGSDLRGWNTSKNFTAYVLGDKTNNQLVAKVIFADLGGDSIPGGSDTTWAYLFGATSTSEDDTDYIVYDAWTNNGEPVELKVESSGDALAEGTIVKYSVDSNGIAEFDEDETITPSAMTAGVLLYKDYDAEAVKGTVTIADATDGKVAIKGAKGTDYSIDPDEDTVVFFIDTDESTGGAQGEMPEPIEDGDNYLANVAYQTKSGSTLKVLVVDSGEIDADIFG